MRFGYWLLIALDMLCLAGLALMAVLLWPALVAVDIYRIHRERKGAR